MVINTASRTGTMSLPKFVKAIEFEGRDESGAGSSTVNGLGTLTATSALEFPTD